MKRFNILIPVIFFILLTAFINKKNKPSCLFKIERSKDANQILYTLNTNENGFLKKKPITAFWIKKTNKEKIEPLTWIQKRYAYGLKYLHSCKDCASFQFVSYNKCNFLLKKIDNNYRVFTKVDDQILEVERIFIQTDGGTFWVPNVTEIQLYARDFNTGKEILHIITP